MPSPFSITTNPRLGPEGLSIDHRPDTLVWHSALADESWKASIKSLQEEVADLKLRVIGLESRTWWSMLKDFLVSIFKHNANRI